MQVARLVDFEYSRLTSWLLLLLWKAAETFPYEQTVDAGPSNVRYEVCELFDGLVQREPRLSEEESQLALFLRKGISDCAGSGAPILCGSPFSPSVNGSNGHTEPG